MMRLFLRVSSVAFAISTVAGGAFAQRALTWQEVRDRFEAANPTLRGGQIGIDESRAQETTAYLRPNPNLTLTADQINPFPGGPPHSTFGFLLGVASLNYSRQEQIEADLKAAWSNDPVVLIDGKGTPEMQGKTGQIN